jgi:hypothetical protein
MSKQRPPKIYYEAKTNKYYLKIGNKKIYLNVGKMTKEQILQKVLSHYVVKKKKKEDKRKRHKKDGKVRLPTGENPAFNAFKNEVRRIIGDVNNGNVASLRQTNEDLKRKLLDLEHKYKEIDFSKVKADLERRDAGIDKKMIEDKSKPDGKEKKEREGKHNDPRRIIEDNYERIPLGDHSVYADPKDAHNVREYMKKRIDEKIEFEDEAKRANETVEQWLNRQVKNKWKQPTMKKYVIKTYGKIEDLGLPDATHNTLINFLKEKEDAKLTSWYNKIKKEVADKPKKKKENNRDEKYGSPKPTIIIPGEKSPKVDMNDPASIESAIETLEKRCIIYQQLRDKK